METQSNTTTSNAESVQPSFDEVVELISTGRADQIPGIKDIPLKINEATPSAATMSRPLKPWERAAAQQDTADTTAAPQPDQNVANTNADYASQS
ncbi:uncharacterized protein FA14DRAFT_187300 [Meira miltonrushii]|uniref:Peroxisomal membrane protein PEX14-like KPWE domain-containing protein n=1 Tax=Meira miltonrushii TaxID=1280837 RepID=A0A316VHV8_9BASI|nr:uncharacterized protein FA14DRAFT_187300 [Meira miltonrushii]PWN37172.1 hypothetical protein FA14DRAFT_187300 [Meira miltonrushii]